MIIKNNQNEIFFRNWLFLIALFLLLFSFPEISQAKTLPTSVSVIITICGNGVIDENEQCDSYDLDGQICANYGYNGGVLSCKNDCTFDTSGCTSGVGGGGGVVYVHETKVIIQGIAYPNADVTILKDGQVAGVVRADASANFKFELPEINPGVWNFSLWTEDFQKRRSPNFSYMLSIQSGMTTTIANVFLPPTIDLDKDKVKKGERIAIFGQTAPKSQVSIYVYSSKSFIKEIKADQAGVYSYNLDTISLEYGDYHVKTKSSLEGGPVSDFSKILNFQVVEPDKILEKPLLEKPHKFIPANLNQDLNKNNNDIINFVDVSILLYNWGKPKNIKTDLNGDGIVNYRDLSILLYYWTG